MTNSDVVSAVPLIERASVLQVEAAVDHKHLAGHVGVVRREQHGLGDLLWVGG